MSIDSLKSKKTSVKFKVLRRAGAVGFFVSTSKIKTTAIFSTAVFIITVAIFGLTALSSTQEAKQQILGTATTGFDLVGAGKQSLLDKDLVEAQDKFANATENFALARQSLYQAGGILSDAAKILPQGRDVDQTLQASIYSARGLSYLVRGLDNFEQIRLDWQTEKNTSGSKFFTQMRDSRTDFLKSQQEVARAVETLGQVNPHNIPTEYQEQFNSAAEELNLAKRVLDKLIAFQNLAVDLLGGESKNYLVLFQNNDELRATGGFIGTYGLVHFENGRLSVDKIESVYHLDGQLDGSLAPPTPIQHFLSDSWGLRDSNWFVDFPASAREAMSFFEKVDGRTVDGVIAVTPDLFEDILKITGPVELDKYGEVLTAANFRSLVQHKTSIDYDKQENRPKQFLSDFAPALLGRFSQLDSKQWLSLVNVFLENIQQKQIIAFSLDKDLQTNFEKLKMDGQIKQTDGDYLAIYQSNLAGGKTDKDIETVIDKTVHINSEGSAEIKLSIEKIHNDYDEEFFPRNVSFIRILVPLGSKLKTASGFDQLGQAKKIADNKELDSDVEFWEDSRRLHSSEVSVGYEAGYTEYSGWIILDPGQSQKAVLTYELPFKVGRTYTQLVQKQPGAQPMNFQLRVDSDRHWSFVHPSRYEKENGLLRFSKVLDTDSFYALVGK